ncbi:MAG: hypothetical protein KDC53_13620 [Saprospiraceae bacterium]|nr:hypothetical protein [Saprospiraceae bacterium]
MPFRNLTRKGHLNYLYLSYGQRTTDLDMDKLELFEYGRELIYEGADHLQVQKALQDMNIETDEIRSLMQILESDFVQYQLAQQEKNKVLQRALMGFLIVFLGIALSLYSSIKDNYLYRIDYGLILGGIWYTFRNIVRYRQPTENFVSAENPKRRRRFNRKF